MSSNNNKVWLVGASDMAIDYFKVLKDLKVEVIVIGRGKDSAKNFYLKTGFAPIEGGVKDFLKKNPNKCDFAIIAAGIEELSSITNDILNYGIKNILVEKPSGLNINQISLINKNSMNNNANVYVAYNRRFYASTLKAKEIIRNDGGVTSFNFEFTEWADIIEPLQKNKIIKENWFLANSSHIADLAFYLGGFPKEIKTYVSGSLSWHKSASIFSGAGITNEGALFNYGANWESAGRWSVEILTKENRLIFKPIEELFLQKKGEINIEPVKNIDYSNDKKYKPGLYLQTSNFINNKCKEMLNINDLVSILPFYNKIANYK